jgi:hypothetical protein
LGFHKTDDGIFAPPGAGKDAIRTIHSVQRDDRLALNRNFISEHFSGLIKYFASGKDIDLARISPVLQRISAHTWESDLFRLAAPTWSVPVSNRFGRSLRYLVWDDHNDKAIGIIAIGDPVFNGSVRDNLIDWDARARGESLVNIMGAYVFGRVATLQFGIGWKDGRLLASKTSMTILPKRMKTTGIISQQEKKARLLAVNNVFLNGAVGRN